MNQLLIDVPKERTFNLPEGNFKAALRDIKPLMEQRGTQCRTSLRFLFEVEVPGMENFECLAGRNFEVKMQKGSDLYRFLEGWLGAEFLRKHSGGKLDFNALLHKECELALSHYKSPEYDRPLVKITSIHPTGTLNLTSEAELAASNE